MLSPPFIMYYMGCCNDCLTCDIAFNAVMPLSRASTRGSYSRIEGVTEGEPALVGDRVLSSYGGSSSGYSSSSGGYAQPPRRRARFEGGSGSSRRCTSVKREEGSG